MLKDIIPKIILFAAGINRIRKHLLFCSILEMEQTEQVVHLGNKLITTDKILSIVKQKLNVVILYISYTISYKKIRSVTLFRKWNRKSPGKNNFF
jgi:myosin-crossreactive antigen